MMLFPTTETLLLQHQDGVLQITLNRPQVRNAMSLQMVQELASIFDRIAGNTAVRAVILRGADGHFCAGGDIKDMISARSRLAESADDPFYALNRAFGRLLMQVESAPQVVIVLLEGAVLGGGFGLACVSDVALARETCQFGLPETSLGVIPAQIAPFVVKRIGLTQARRLALLGARFDGQEAWRLGLVHQLLEAQADAEAALSAIIQQVMRCAPEANAKTKALLLRVGEEPMNPLLDDAARDFSQAVQGAEGTEGTLAFMQKRKPRWASLD